MRLFTHKISIVGRELIQHQLPVFRLAIIDQVLYVIFERVESHTDDRVGKASGDELPFFRQINPIILMYKLYKTLEFLVIYR